MKYLVRIIVAATLMFMFCINLLAIATLWDELPMIISIFWLIGTSIIGFFGLYFYELIVVKVKKLLMVLANDTIDYYKKGDINE